MRLLNVDIPAVTVTDLGAVPVPPQLPNPPERDDNPVANTGAYSLRRLRFSIPPRSRFDPASVPPPRVYEGLLATPNTPAPADGYPPIVAVNGHGGSADAVMTGANDLYWYGDSLARRGFAVLAVDIGHRPVWNQPPPVHAPVLDAGYATSNWEEDGERAFSVRRAIDWLLAQPSIRTDRLCMTGLSLGGEVTTITSALDVRIKMAVAAGFSPDMYVMDRHGNHRCYRWLNADIHEYLDVSDYLALVAPRPFVVETGRVDPTFSSLTSPFASDKQVLNRGYCAYSPQQAQLIHYLHYDQHHWHVGDVDPINLARPRGVMACVVTGPTAPGDYSWQTNTTTTLRSPTLYDLIDQLVP